MSSNKRRITMIVPVDSTVDKWVRAQNTQSQSINLALTLIANKYGNRDLLEAMSQELLGMTPPTSKPEQAQPEQKKTDKTKDDDDIGFMGY